MSLITPRKPLCHTLFVLSALLFLFAACPNWSQPFVLSNLTQVANWGATAPSIFPNSVQVEMMPVVAQINPQKGEPEIIFVSFETHADAAGDQNGVLRVIDFLGNDIASYPDANHPQVPPTSCLGYANFATAPHLSPISGLAIGTVQSGAAIVGVLDDHTGNKAGVAVFKLIGGLLVPLWCSAALPAGDSIPRASAPVVAQLDAAPAPASIIVHNKVYDGSGNLRFSGGPDCSTCIKSRTPLVANLTGVGLPQIITGSAIYTSMPGTIWTSPTVTLLPNITAGSITYPAIADLDNNGTPEIIVTDAGATTLHVYSNTGVALVPPMAIPDSSGNHCGGAPMIANVDGTGGPEIGVASCTNYTVFKYSGGILPALSQYWTYYPLVEPSGDTTSTFFRDRNGLRKIYYADSQYLRVFLANSNTGTPAVLQTIANTSDTALEGPVIAGLGTAAPYGPARLIVAANNYHTNGNGTVGIRIFSDKDFGNARGVWNEYSYHQTNVTNNQAAIPASEPASWQPSINSYRVQQ